MGDMEVYRAPFGLTDAWTVAGVLGGLERQMRRAVAPRLPQLDQHERDDLTRRAL